MTGLRIAVDLELPTDVAVESSAFLGKKGSGKSNGLVVLAEEMHAAGIPWVAVDPKGDYWGIRSNADGTGPGLPVVVFGGKHGDVPLEPTAGSLVADLIVGDDDRGYLTCVLDVSQFTITDQRRFLLDFGERLFRRKDEEGVLHLFLEEAHEYLPQMTGGGGGGQNNSGVRLATLVSTWQRIVKQGRFKGLGVTVASQRSAALNKDVLTQVDSLYAMRVLSPQDRAAIKAWVEVNSAASEVVGTLHELAPGECWLWSPDRFPDPKRFRFRQRWTFDSGATPKVGQVRKTPRTLADVDLGAVKEQMTETIERAKADDPKELRKKIRDLERQLADRPTEPVEVEVPVEVQVPVLDPAIAEQLITAASLVADYATQLRDAIASWPEQSRATSPIRRSAPESATKETPVTGRTSGNRGPATTAHPQATPPQARARRPAGDGPPSDIGKGERTILIAVASHRSGVTPEQLTVLTGYKRSSRNTYVQRLRSAGYIVTDTGRITATDAGIDALGDDYEPLPTGVALRAYWLDRLGDSGEAVILAALIDTYPNGLTGEEIDEQTPYKRSSRNTYLQRLRARELITTTGGVSTAADTLFDGGR